MLWVCKQRNKEGIRRESDWQINSIKRSQEIKDYVGNINSQTNEPPQYSEVWAFLRRSIECVYDVRIVSELNPRGSIKTQMVLDWIWS
jgi:hypothetical protein